MHSIWASVFGLMGLLALAVLLVPAARRFYIPHTVLLAAFGCILGFMKIALNDVSIFDPLSDFLNALEEFEISSELVFFIFLPALVFEAALSIDVRRLMDDLVPIMFLAVIGLLVSTAAIAFSLSALSGMSIIVCLLLGSIVSATDPVAVVAIFKEVGAPKRLAILVEGESLFNDATAIVAFTILLNMVTGSSEIGFLFLVASFIKIFFGGVIIGFITGRILCKVISLLKDLPLVVVTLTISLSYLTFIIAEHYYHVSGVMAVVTAALVLGSRGRTVITPNTWNLLHHTWEQIGFWANSIVFILVGMAVPVIMAGFNLNEALLLAALIISAFSARAFIVFGLIPVLGYFKLSHRVSTAFKSVILWGGLRGAVSLALALVVMENTAIDDEIRHFVSILVTGFVLFTLLVNATTIRLVMNFFGLGNLSTIDIAVRDRATLFSLSQVSTRLNQVTDELKVQSSMSQLVTGKYLNLSNRAQNKLNTMDEVKFAEWLVIGLMMLIAQERSCYTKLYGEGLLSSLTFRLLIKKVDDLSDATKQYGIKGYEKQINHALGFNWRFRLAVYLQRHIGLAFPLSHRIAERFDVLIGTQVTLTRLLNTGLPEVLTMIDDSVKNELTRIINTRFTETTTALDAVKLQYPHYALNLEQRYLENSAMRFESEAYQTMLSNSVINEEVFNDLQEGIEKRLEKIENSPKLDLGLDPEKLLNKVPLFENLSLTMTQQLAKLLKPVLAFPDEKILQKGDKGDTMYFISSGVLTVSLADRCFMLGSGDFFGEIALISYQPRNATVIAKGFCELLVLNRKDFNCFLQNHPTIKSTIERIAQQRIEEDMPSC